MNWLGHKDGGALAMKVYGHLRDHHSVAMAQKVSFSNPGPELHGADRYGGSVFNFAVSWLMTAGFAAVTL